MPLDKSTRRVLATTAAAALILGTAACGSSSGGSTPPPVTPGSSSAAPEDSGAPGAATIAIAGDAHFMGRTADLLADPATVFGPVAEVFTRADFAMLNFETSVTDSDDGQPKQYKFKTTPAAYEAVKAAGVDLVSLANNHTLDYGRDGLVDTLDAAEASGMPVFGAGADIDAALEPYVVDLKGTSVAFVGASQVWELWDTWMATDDEPGIAHVAHEDQLIAAVEDAAERADVVILMMHWGTEGDKCPNDEQKDWAKRLSEAGADAIVGTHAHLLQGEGWMGDSYVAYGLGNFLWYRDDAYSNDTGVLELSVADGELTGTAFVPAFIDGDGRPVPSEGTEADRITGKLAGLRGCTGLKDERG
ncbi:CapA family protein [Phytomonospora sp. NPDC050363]|uniref:CapA family protein n=1 Tax=Phytomonospora sp. NPDC050363 TaxID=3155642 RepID=UPI0033E80BB9